jgi:heterodisulfide reductase subunit D
MAAIDELVGSRSVEEEVRHCMRCGLCLSACPSYRQSLSESDSPRARVALQQALREGLLDLSDQGVAEAYFRCLLCGACAFVCPSGVAVDRIIEVAREELSREGCLPDILAELTARILQYRNVAAEDNADRLIWAANLPRPPTAIGKTQAEVAYFVGCVASFFPRSYAIPQSFVQVLDRLAIDYTLLGGSEWCCGYPLLLNGDIDSARELIQHNVEAIQKIGARTVVFTCPSCVNFWRQTYPQVMQVDDLGFNVQHVTEFLAEVMDATDVKLNPLPFRVTYHDPCDLGRKLGVTEAPRSILRRIPGIQLVEMPENRENSRCCGGGGNLESLAPDVSGAIAAERVRQAMEVNAEIIVSACQQCERTLSAAVRADRLRVRVEDVVQLLLRALEGD